MSGENKRVISELAIFAEGHLEAIKEMNERIQRIEKEADICKNEDERGAMLLQSYVWQRDVALIEKKLEELRRTAEANEPFAEPF